MALAFHHVGLPPVRDFTAQVPGGAIVGVIGERGSGTRELARVAARLEQPASGQVAATGAVRYLGPLDALDLSPADVLIVDHTLACQDALARAQASVALHRLRAQGASILLLSHEPALLRELCEELWWLDQGALAAQGDPGEVLESYQCSVAVKLRAWGDGASAPITPALRKGDGRAEILALETLGAAGRPTMTWQSGEQVSVRVVVRFREPVDNPVIGILIRTRIGLEVYGTNTELEKLPLGRCIAGQTIAVHFRFACHLCPKEYILTAASHDPDGTAHDWLDDAVAFLVADGRFTAGVANLRARVELSHPA